MKKILAIAIIAGFTFTSCGHSICDAYSYDYKKDTKENKAFFGKALNDASAEALG
jgi:hypothetical protein